MRKDLHEMQIVEESKYGGSFPRCMVSRSTFELIDLMEKVLRAANDLSGKQVEEYVLTDIQERLQATIPMVLEKYATKTIDAHGKFLQTIPQQTALFHNNCSYLAWWLSNVGNNSNDIVVQIERRDCIITSLLEDRSKRFAQQISNQRSQLMDILKEFDLTDSMVELGPTAYKDPLDVSIYVKHWVKLQQIKMILNASMGKIAEQWAGGKGPLTLHFRAEDVRHLIRALFQNTDRRANVLSTIV
ncbi:centromere/kinetochore protein zw10-like [Sitodiplosis mosellana]|uniref:centromere/kinetochore protein zw10-like n=1 Tax=Sitodiplosis mosellana TaxID=263140 RepID=UPI00244539CC|nr:centromere/kinetochore protein zw10-like [Sitodiplosis mosellana]